MKPATYPSFWLTFCSGICFVLAFYPVGWAWTGWLAPIGVTLLILKEKLPGAHPKLQIWLGSFVCWLLLFQCIRLPHWGGYLGWPILSAYLGSYLFFFVLVTRHVVHRWKLPMIFAAPVVWVGLEYLQAHWCTGISLGMLSHTQAGFPLVIQVADLGGCYTVSFFMVGIVSALVVALKTFKTGASWLALVQAVVLCGVLVGYGVIRIRDADEKMEIHDFKIGLIQGSKDTLFPAESEYQAYIESFTRHYMELSKKACQQELNLVLWPESMFPVPDLFSSPGYEMNSSEQKMEEESRRNIEAVAHLATGSATMVSTPEGTRLNKTRKPVPMLVGAHSIALGHKREIFNSGVLINDQGKVVSRYGKMKLVLFGEFVPLGQAFPWLYRFFPIPPGLQAGNKPVAMDVNQFVFCPNICFESTYPHLIRLHCLSLASEEKKPDVLVNLSNDGWFWGSNALDMHFANNVYRSVENRTPTIIASNTGFSGQIDSAGRIRAKGPRRTAKLVFVDLLTSRQSSPYHRIGDWPAFLCFLGVLVFFFSWIFAPFLSGKLQLNEHLDGPSES